jgi:hypothetical protein
LANQSDGGSHAQSKPVRRSKRLSKSELKQELIRLRREAGKEIERLIDLLDRTETYDPVTGAISAYDEREPPVDDEPSLGGGDGRDLEADYADNEPSLGWTERAEEGGGQCGGFEDREVCIPVGTAAQYARYRRSDRWATKTDGKHVDAEPYFAGRKRIRNLSNRQRNILEPKINRSKVCIY